MADTKQPKGSKSRKRGGVLFGPVLVTAVTLVCIAAVTWLLLRPGYDPGNRVWILNHTPDQVVIVNPYAKKIEKKFQVADGLKDLAFSRDFSVAYIGNMVDVTNKLSVLDTATYLKEEIIEIDGIPQGIGVFPDNNKVAVITASKADFMAGGFDVLDLTEQSTADPTKKKRLYRERDLQLTHKIAVGDDGDRIYCVDAKSDLLTVFSFREKRKLREINLHGAPQEFYYPRAGDYFYVSVLQHKAIYQLDKATDTISAVYIFDIPDLNQRFKDGKLRHMTVDSTGKYLIGTNYEKDAVAIWQIGNPEHYVSPMDIPFDPADGKTYLFEDLPYYLPMTRFKLEGGYNPNNNFVPGPQHVAMDQRDDFIYVIDEEGALYIYDFKKALGAIDMEVLKSEDGTPITEFANNVTEIRDMQVSQPTKVIPKGNTQ